MSRKEVPRAGLLKASLAGKITNAQGALAMHVGVRQFQRVKVRIAAEVRTRAAALLQTIYAGLNDCHAIEKLREVDGFQLSRSSVRRLRRALGLPLALYGDRFGVFVRHDPHWTLEEELRGTQDQALGRGAPVAVSSMAEIWRMRPAG